MEAQSNDKGFSNKLLSAVNDCDDTDTDSSALYYSTVEDLTIETYNDESTLDAIDHEISLEKTMEKTVQQTKTPLLINSPAAKRIANSPLIKSLRKSQMLKQNLSSSTPHPEMPDSVRGNENDINYVNKSKISKLTLDFTEKFELETAKNGNMEIVNQKLEQIKLELPNQPNWRFTSPSNPAFVDSSEEKKPSPGQIQFEKIANRVSVDFEDLNSIEPPLTDRASMSIDDFHAMKDMFKVKTPAKQIILIESEESEDISPEEIKAPKSLQQAFEKMASEMANSSIDEMVAKEEQPVKVSQLPKRTSISTAYRRSVLSKVNSIPGPSQTENSQIPAARKRATWASRAATVHLSGIFEDKPTMDKKWSPKLNLAQTGTSKLNTRKSSIPTTNSRRSVMPSASVKEVTTLKKRQSLHPAALKPTHSAPSTIKSEPEKKMKATSLKIATVKVGNRRSSFGNPVGKPNIRKSMLPSRASPRPTRRSVMPPPSSSLLRNTLSSRSLTGAIPKQTVARASSKSDLQCKYCDKKFAIVKGLDDHLLIKCTKIPPKDKKKLLSQNYAARELEYSRKPIGNRSVGNQSSKLSGMDSSGASCSSVSSNSGMPPPKSSGLKTKRSEHSGIVHTPNKQIVCMACGMKFGSVLNYTVHMTSVHVAKQDSTDIENPESPNDN